MKFHRDGWRLVYVVSQNDFYCPIHPSLNVSFNSLTSEETTHSTVLIATMLECIKDCLGPL